MAHSDLAVSAGVDAVAGPALGPSSVRRWRTVVAGNTGRRAASRARRLSHFPFPLLRCNRLAQPRSFGDTRDMLIKDTEIAEVKILRPVRHGDSRGFFSEVFREDILLT